MFGIHILNVLTKESWSSRIKTLWIKTLNTYSDSKELQNAESQSDFEAYCQLIGLPERTKTTRLYLQQYNGGLNTGQNLVRYSNGINGPFGDRTT